MPLAEPPVRAPGIETGFDAGISGAVFSDSGLLAATLGDGTIQLVSPDHQVRDAQAHDGAILCLALDIDGQGFVTGGDDGRLVRTSPDGGTMELLNAPGWQIDVLATSRPAKARAVAVGKEVRLLDGNGAVRARASDHPSTVAGLAFNSKGKRLAVAHYGGVTLWWTAALGQTPKRLDWRGSHIGVSWSPDGTHVMTAMQECELHGWRVADGEDMAMRGYAAKVRSMDWLAKPPVLVSSGSECVVAWSFAGSGPQGKPPTEVGQDIGKLVTQVAVHGVTSPFAQKCTVRPMREWLAIQPGSERGFRNGNRQIWRKSDNTSANLRLRKCLSSLDFPLSVQFRANGEVTPDPQLSRNS